MNNILWEFKEGKKIHRITCIGKRNYTYSDGEQEVNEKEGNKTFANTGARYYSTVEGAIKTACKNVVNNKEVETLREYLREYRLIAIEISTIIEGGKSQSIIVEEF